MVLGKREVSNQITRDEFIAWTEELEKLYEELQKAGGFYHAPKNRKERYRPEHEKWIEFVCEKIREKQAKGENPFR